MPNAREPRAPVVNTLSRLLASGRSSPLFDALVRRQQVATNVFAFNFGFVDGAAMLVVSATNLIDETGLQRVQATARYGLVNQLQTMGGFGGRGDMLAQGWLFHRDAGWVNRWVQQLGAVTVPQLRELAAERMVPDNRAILVFVPRPRPTPAPTQP